MRARERECDGHRHRETERHRHRKRERERQPRHTWLCPSENVIHTEFERRRHRKQEGGKDRYYACVCVTDRRVCNGEGKMRASKEIGISKESQRVEEEKHRRHTSIVLGEGQGTTRRSRRRQYMYPSRTCAAQIVELVNRRRYAMVAVLTIMITQ